MTLFPFYLLSKKTKQNWLDQYSGRLESEFKQTIDKLQESHGEMLRKRESELRRNQADLEDLIQRTDDRKVELEAKKNELREQIRLIEAKASPDSVWITAFSAGFTKAWDMMQPLMTEGVQKMKQAIRDQAINETLDGLETHIQDKAEKIADDRIKTTKEIAEKKSDLRNRIANSKSKTEEIQLTHYLEALNWAYADDILIS